MKKIICIAAIMATLLVTLGCDKMTQVQIMSSALSHYVNIDLPGYQLGTETPYEVIYDGDKCAVTMHFVKEAGK